MGAAVRQLGLNALSWTLAPRIRLRSARMLSGCEERRKRDPLFSISAKTTSKPRRVSRRDSMSRFISLSSTRKPSSFLYSCPGQFPSRRLTPQCLADGRSNINFARRGFFIAV